LLIPVMATMIGIGPIATGVAQAQAAPSPSPKAARPTAHPAAPARTPLQKRFAAGALNGVCTPETFAAPSQWSSVAFYGSVTNLAGDFNGDGKSDLVAVSSTYTYVILSNGAGFSAPTLWSSVAFYGNVATLAADVNGDGKTDLVAVNTNSVYVMLSTGSGFSAPVLWSSAVFYGGVATFAADVNGDGKADMVAESSASASVMLSTGTGFAAPVRWSSSTFSGSKANLAADVTGDGKADLVAMNGTSTSVMSSTGSAFSAPTVWSSSSFSGGVANLAADLTGNHVADLVAMNAASALVMLSTGSSFSSPAQWSSSSFSGTRGNFAVDVNGDGRADLVAMNSNTISVMLATPNTCNRAPLNVSAFPGSGQATVHWTPPLSAIGAVASYSVQAFKSGAAVGSPVTVGGGATVATVGSLTNGSTPAYTFAVTATDGQGPGPASTLSNPATPNLPAPPSFTASPGLIPYTGGPPTTGRDGAAYEPMTAVADLRHLGRHDVVIVNNHYGPGYNVFLDNGDGTYTTPSLVSEPTLTPIGMAVGDVTGDGKPDLIIEDSASNALLVFPGNGSGGFGSQLAALPFPNGTLALFNPLAADVRHNGHVDIVACGTHTGASQGQLALFPSNGDGTFGTVISSPLLLNVSNCDGSVIPATLGDGGIDIVAGLLSGFEEVFRWSTSSTTLAPVANGRTYQTTAPGGTVPTQTVIADVNGDGIPDLIVGHCDPGSAVFIYLGNGDGTFTGAGSIDPVGNRWLYPAGSFNVGSVSQSSDVAVGDFNGDGIADIAVIGENNSVYFALGWGDGLHYTLVGTATVDPQNTQEQALGVMALDINHDGKTDAVVVTGNEVSLITNLTSALFLPGSIPTTATTAGASNPALPCACQLQSSQNQRGDPVNTASGNLYEAFTELAAPTRSYPLAFAPTYNVSGASSLTALGWGWTYQYGMHLYLDSATADATIVQEGGAMVPFAAPLGSTPGQPASTYAAPAAMFATLSYGAGQWTFVRQGRDTYTFDQNGNLTAETDKAGDGVQLVWGIAGGTGSGPTACPAAYATCTTIQDMAPAAAGNRRVLRLDFAAGGQLLEADDMGTAATPLRTVGLHYDSAGNLVEIDDPNNGSTHPTKLGYDSGHRLTWKQDPRGFYTLNCYDSSNRVTYQYTGATSNGFTCGTTPAGARATHFSYVQTSNGYTVTITDPVGNLEVDSFQTGFLASRTVGASPTVSTWSYTYDPATWEQVKVTDANNHATTTQYDASGNRLQVMDPLNRITSWTYNSLNQPLSEVDPPINPPSNLVQPETVWTYDSSGDGHVVQSQRGSTSGGTFTAVATTSDTYCNQDLATCQAFDGTSQGWDLWKVTDADGQVSKAGTDGYGVTNKSQDAAGNTTTMVNNADGWMTSKTMPRQNAGTCGNCTWNYTYNNVGETLTQVSPVGGNTTTSTYDPNGNLSTYKDGNQTGTGTVTTDSYDAWSELTQVQRADGSLQVTDYNGDGAILDQKAETSGQSVLGVTSYGYDNQDRPCYAYVGSSSAACGSPPSGSTTDSYFAGGQLNVVTDARGKTTTMAYDAANQLTGISYNDGTANVSALTYDGEGHKLGWTDGTGSSVLGYDVLGRLTTSQDGSGAGAAVSYGYDNLGLQTSLAYPGGNCGATPSLCVTRTYYANGLLHTISDFQTAPNTQTTTFTYDADGNLTAEVMGTSGATDSFGYDAADRMTSVSDTGTFTAGATYTRDKAEQLTQEVPSGGFGAAQLNAGYDSNERTCYTAPTAGSLPTCAAPPPAPTPYAYDAADNVTLAGATSLSYNGAQEPCWSLSGGAAVACTGTPTSSYTQYGYDARGDRTSVGPYGGTQTTLTYDAANRMTSDGAANTYSYSAGALRMSKTVSSTTTAYAWDVSGGLPAVLREGTSTYDIYDAQGLPLEQISAGVVAWYHHDQVGSTRAVTSSTGSVLGQYAYDAYGNLTSGSQGSYPFLYAGQYRDSESGLYYMRARYYDPATAQFLTRDPMVATTLSPYGYVAGNPLNGADPSGLIDPSQLSIGQFEQVVRQCAGWQRQAMCIQAAFCTGDACAQIAQIAFNNYEVVANALASSSGCNVTFNGYTESRTAAQRDLAEMRAAQYVAAQDISWENDYARNGAYSAANGVGGVGLAGAGICAVARPNANSTVTAASLACQVLGVTLIGGDFVVNVLNWIAQRIDGN
jgi:RHS repeat-associated protein